MLTDAGATALKTAPAVLSVLADARTFAVSAGRALASMRANACAIAVFTNLSSASVLAETRSAALSTSVSPPSMLANASASAFFAMIALAIVFALLGWFAHLRHGCRYRLQQAPQLLTPYISYRRPAASPGQTRLSPKA